MTKNDINEAMKCTKEEIKTKNDSFLVLSSLNLLNAAVKIEEHKKQVSYSFIKPAISRLVQYCIKSQEHNLIDEICYDAKIKCMYLRCFDIQFSFHYINTSYIDPDILEFISNKSAIWDGIRLQPIALELYQLAKDCRIRDISDTDTIKKRFQRINN
ncbi:MAG: hypothetical protein ACRCZY_07390 [Phocaeicola sp.]